MSMDKWLSNKFRWMSFIATWAVVCLHSRTDRWSVGTSDWSSWIQCHVSDMFHFAVPLFFLISGYFFVRSYKEYGWGGVLRRKFQTLYIPAVCWMTISMIALLPIRLYSGVAVSFGEVVIAVPLLMSERVGTWHFWYVRMLILLFLASPVLVHVIRKRLLVFIVVALTMCIPEASWASQKHIPVAVSYFLVGSLISSGVYCRCSMPWPATLTSGFFLVISVVAKWMGVISGYYFGVLVQPAFAIVFLWGLYDWIDRVFGIPRYPECLNVMFFVYCVHQIVLCWVGGVMRVTLGTGPVSRIFGYFLLWQTFWIDVFIANCVRKYLSRVYNVLVGGR